MFARNAKNTVTPKYVVPQRRKKQGLGTNSVHYSLFGHNTFDGYLTQIPDLEKEKTLQF
jgi:hypothetical protein